MSEYYGYITRLQNIKPHPNADRLQLCVVFNNQVVISTDMHEGDMVFYVPTDMVLSKRFCEENKLLRSLGGFIEENCRVRSVKLRGERSDGIVLPVKSLSSFTDVAQLKQGDKIGTLGGEVIVTKYIPPVKYNSSTENMKAIKGAKERFPLFAEHVDTKQFDYNLNEFNVNDEIVITEKVHGTSGRTAFNKSVIKREPTFLDRLLKRTPATITGEEYVTGSRRVVLDRQENKNAGFYGQNDFRFKYHNYFQDGEKLLYGEEIYYEIVGYIDVNGTPIMPSVANSKVQDKEFSKIYGDYTHWTYGCKSDLQGLENDIYVYRMTYTTREGFVIEYPWDLVKLRCEQIGIKHVPELDRFMFTTVEDLVSRVDVLLDKPSTIDNRHVSEGVVVRRNNSTKFDSYKKKGWYFRVLEGLAKDMGVADMEESQSVEDSEC